MTDERPLRERLTEAGNKFDGHTTNGSMDEVMKIVQPIVEEREELDKIFELVYASDMRAIKMWQEAHPGNELVWPDRTKMIFWLLEQLPK